VIAEIKGNSSYVCQDLRTNKLLPLHVTRLKPYDATITEDATVVAAADNDEWRVELIVDHRGPPRGRPRRALEFRVRWLGYGPADDTWLPYSEVSELEALDAYAARHPELRL